MAAIEVNVSMADSEGAKSVASCWLPDTTTLAFATAFAEAWALALDDMTGCVITKVGLVFGVDLPGGLKTAADANTDVEQGGMFVFATGGGYLTRVRVPGFLKALIIGSSDAIDLTAATVAAFVTLMTDGDGDASPSDNRGEDITGLRSAKEAYSKQRR